MIGVQEQLRRWLWRHIGTGWTRRRPLTAIALLLVLSAAAYVWIHPESALERLREPPASQADGVEGEALVLRAFANGTSNAWVEAEGVVERQLPDDTQGARHQRFILRLQSGHTLLISHNIDLAARLDDLEGGDLVSFRGEYEWNAQGGVIHWTHHDPDGRRAGGWLEHAGRRYR